MVLCGLLRRMSSCGEDCLYDACFFQAETPGKFGGTLTEKSKQLRKPVVPSRSGLTGCAHLCLSLSTDMSFSGAVKLADINDYLAPSQACIKPQLDAKRAQQAREKGGSGCVERCRGAAAQARDWKEAVTWDRNQDFDRV